MQIDLSFLPEGLLIAVVGYIVVFIALASLYYIFRYLPDLLHLQIRSRLRRQGKLVEKEEDISMVGDVTAAIATALYLYFDEMHDEEQAIMTIKKVSKTYSPWSSKIFGVMDRRKR